MLMRRGLDFLHEVIELQKGMTVTWTRIKEIWNGFRQMEAMIPTEHRTGLLANLPPYDSMVRIRDLAMNQLDQDAQDDDLPDLETVPEIKTYMTFRAAREGVVMTLTADYFRHTLRMGIRHMFGCSTDEKGRVLTDVKNPDALFAFRNPGQGEGDSEEEQKANDAQPGEQPIEDQKENDAQPGAEGQPSPPTEEHLQSIRDRLRAIGIDTSETTDQQLMNNAAPTPLSAGIGGKSVLEANEEEYQNQFDFFAQFET